MCAHTVNGRLFKIGQGVLLVLLVGCYLVATLPKLADFPIVETAQMGIAAPAYKLAAQGVYGNDLYRGFHNSELYNYEYMPLYPLLVALSFKLLGLGVWQARLVSVTAGLAAIVLTFQLGRQLYSSVLGLIAAAVLCLLPIAVSAHGVGNMYPGSIPFLDIARVLRYDILVPALVLAATLSFLWAHSGKSGIGYLATGVFGGLATLTHVYGAFILAVLGVVLIWQDGWSVLRRPQIYLILVGWLAVLSPWVLYILQDTASFAGQLQRHETRFTFLKLGFYLDNVLREPWRYLRLLGRFRQPVLWPRPGFWLMLVAVFAANWHLWRSVIRHKRLTDRLLFISLPMLMLLLGVLISFKRYTYIALILPFLALQVACGLVVLWSHAGRRRWQILLIAVFLMAVLDGGLAVKQNLEDARTITPYLDVTEQARSVIPEGSRVMMLHNYWLGFASYDVVSLDLAFVLSNPEFDIVRPSSMEQVIAELEPDYVVVEEELLRLYQRDPDALPSESVRLKWGAFDAHVQNHCLLVWEGTVDPQYGTVIVFNCQEEQVH